MVAVTVLYHSFFTSTGRDFVCDDERPRSLSLSYTNAYTPTTVTYNYLSFLSLRRSCCFKAKRFEQ